MRSLTKSYVRVGRTTIGCGAFAPLAASSAVVSQAGTTILAALAVDKSSSGGNFSVDYRVRAHAEGRVPQASQRREPRSPTEAETVAARAIDRAVRPMFSKGAGFEAALTVTVHSLGPSADDPVSLAVNAASLALLLGHDSWEGPVGCVSIAAGGWLCAGGPLEAGPRTPDLLADLQWICSTRPARTTW